jgi:hypothetical protein
MELLRYKIIIATLLTGLLFIYSCKLHTFHYKQELRITKDKGESENTNLKYRGEADSSNHKHFFYHEKKIK